ncbi:MAG: serpin family protein [Chloroflexota bacterium]
MKKVLISILMTLVLVGLTACSAVAPTDIPTITGELMGFQNGVLQSELQRLDSPYVKTTDQDELVDGNSAFAFDLYQQLKQAEGNLFYSPYSISLALAMTYAGARSETEQQMADTLNFILEQEKLHNAFNWLDQQLAQRGEGAQGKDGEGFRLNVANSIWGQEDYQFLADFLDVLAENYGAGLRGLDFINQPEESRQIINRWVEEQTEGRIKDLIPKGSIDAEIRLVLANAIYFNAAWEHQFNEDSTIDMPFHLLDGDTIYVPTMRGGGSLNYADGNGYQAVELPYDGGQLSMVILLPDEGNFSSFENSLDAQLVSDIIQNMESQEGSLTMPKFEFESEMSLKETLAAMGMPVAFSASANFSGMDGKTGKDSLYIGDVIHKAFVAVDENGTEAAAATAVIMVGKAPPADPPVNFNMDRPFIFLIRDIETDSILFVGRVLNPNA